MDEMRINLSSKFMRNIVSKIISRSIYKKYGYEVNVQLNGFKVEVIDGETIVNTNVEVKAKNEDIKKYLKSMSEEF